MAPATNLLAFRFGYARSLRSSACSGIGLTGVPSNFPGQLAVPARRVVEVAPKHLLYLGLRFSAAVDRPSLEVPHSVRRFGSRLEKRILPQRDDRRVES